MCCFRIYILSGEVGFLGVVLWIELMLGLAEQGFVAADKLHGGWEISSGGQAQFRHELPWGTKREAPGIGL